MTLRNYGKQKCPNGLRKFPTAAERPNFTSKYTKENGEFWPKNGLRNYGKLKLPVFLMVSIHCSAHTFVHRVHEIACETLIYGMIDSLCWVSTLSA